MSPENFRGLPKMSVESTADHVESTPARAALSAALTRFPDSKVLNDIGQLSDEDIAVIDYVLNKADVTFNAFATFEESENTSRVEEYIQAFAMTYARSAKEELAKKMIDIVDR